MKIYLAPMEGVVDSHMRTTLTSLGGFDYCVTEFIRVTDRCLPARVFHRLCPELLQGGKTVSGTPVIVQLLGSHPEAMAQNAELAAELGAPGIDLNFGCPAKTVNKRKGGAILLREPEKLFDVISAVRNAVNPRIPVSAKIRLGYEDTSLALENAHAVQEAGADFITVHARTKVDGYKAPARWEWLARINEALQIPVVANGDINSVEGFEQCLAISGCEQIMIGRGAIAQPDLAKQIQQHLTNQRTTALRWQDIIELVIRYGVLLRTVVDDKKTISRIKQWLGLLRKQFNEAELCFKEARQFKHYDEMFVYLSTQKSAK